MAQEVETAGVLSLGGFFRRHKSEELLPVGTPCPNCSAPLAGPWCHACGQLGEDFHRSAYKLLRESFGEFADLDNRLWKTLPNLLFRPGRLTRAYLDGHRAPQVPPLRLFLVILLALFLIGLSRSPALLPASPVPAAAAQRADAIKQIENNKDIPEGDRKEIIADMKTNKGVLERGSANAEVRWWLTKVNYAKAHQTECQAIQNWAERFAVLVLPLSAILLSVLFVFQRQYFLFDHIIFSMHSLSFVCLLLGATIVVNRYTPLQVDGVPLLAAPVHLFFHMRGVYRTSILGTLMRMFALFVGTTVGCVFLLIGLVWVAFNAIG
jgi:uncharacterized protein DUF3667